MTNWTPWRTHKKPRIQRILRTVKKWAPSVMPGISLVFLTMLVATLWAAKTHPEQRKFELKAESPAFWKLVPPDATLTTLATGLGFTEGPVWDPSGFLYVSDEELNKIFRIYLDGHREELISLGDPDGNTYDSQHQLLDCASYLRAIIRISPAGKIQVLADKFAGKRFNSPNDVVMGPDGAIYFTDPTPRFAGGPKKGTPVSRRVSPGFPRPRNFA